MQQTYPAASSGPSRAAPTNGSNLRQSITSPAKSRLTIRLPDLNTPRDLPNDGGPVESNGPSRLNKIAPQTARPQPAGNRETASVEPLAILPRRLPQKILMVVRQPNFWLACGVAIAVQLLLAAVMTPAEGDGDREDRPPIAAEPPTKAVPAPAARIVVPAAPLPSETSDPTDGSAEGATTTPMGLTAPLDLSPDAAPHGAETTEATAGASPSPAARIAENRRVAGENPQYDGRTVGEVNGATLGGIMPLEPAPDSITNEHPQ
jgi:hypothetical protein